ncbi:MAG: hypothetical protein R3C03_17115 [Pirellulaceae bacterium]
MARKSQQQSRRFVDMWAMPGLHPTNNQFLQRLKSADTTHFTRNMQVVGTVSTQDDESRKWEKTHLIGIRSDIWQPSDQEVAETLENLRERRREEIRRSIKRSGRLNTKQSERLESEIEEDHIMQMDRGDIESRRLVLKLFKTTGNRTNWAGTLEQVTTSEIHNSLGSKRSLITLAVMLPRMDVVTTIQENHRTFRLPPLFTFCFYENGAMHHVMLSKRWVSFGPDYDLTIDNQNGGLLNGRLFGFGTDSLLELSGHPLVVDTQFSDLLTLFAASVGYHSAMRKSIARRVSAVKAGHSFKHVIEDEEIRLRHNGRSAA